MNSQGKKWTENEIQASVEEYLKLRDAELRVHMSKFIHQ